MRRLIESHDIIQFEGACFGDLVNAIGPEKAVVYDAHNVEYDYARSESRRPWVRRISSKRIRALEKGIVQRADHTLTCSDSDAHRLQELYDVGGNKFTTAPNGIHLDRRTQRMTESEAAERHPGLLDHPVRAIFSGSDVKHNRAAVQFLLDSVAPRLRGDCAFVFKGQCARQFTGCQLDNVFYDLTPGNVGTYADVCTVALNPVTQGSGTSLKVLDYLAHGFPLISTEFGMRGFEDLMNLVALVEPKGFVDALRNQPRLATEIRGALEKYSWAYVAETACNVYRSLQPSDSVSSEVQV